MVQGNGTSSANVEQQIGVGMAYLLTRTDWVHRRTEVVRFVDARRVRRQMGVDFTLPRNEDTDALQRLRPGLVPLGTLQKLKLERFSMWDEELRALPLLNTAENGFYAAAALTACARGVAVGYGRVRTPRAILRLLREIARRDPGEARLFLRTLRGAQGDGDAAAVWQLAGEDESLAQALTEFPEHAPFAALLFDGPPRDAEPRPEHPRQRALSAVLRSLAEQLASDFIVLTVLRGTPDDHFARRIVKFDYEEAPHAYKPAPAPFWGAGGRGVRWERPLQLAKQAGEVLGWWPHEITLDAVPVGFAQSHHIEIEAPADIDIVGARISAWERDFPARRYEDSADGVDEQRLHLHVPDAPRAAVGPLWVQVRSSRRGFLRAALLTSVVLAAMLWLGRSQLGQITNAGPPGALLLAGPGLMAAYLLRPGEHLMASRLLAGPRAFLLGEGLCIFAAVGALAGQYSAARQAQVWSLAATVATVFAIALALSYVLPWARRRNRPDLYSSSR